MSDATGRTVLTIIGQVVGGYFAGPVGAAIGGYIGAQAGYALFPLDPVEGPRRPNLELTSASYGAGIPTVYGRFRLPGVLIDASEIREVVYEEEVGGKGGPEQTVRTYRYYADVCLLLCAGPIVGVRKIWANGELIYDASDDASAATLIGSAQRAESIRVYTGSATQLPDPTFEALRGVGNVPAYRHVAYLVLENLELAHGVLPTFQVEVFTAGSFGIGTAKPLITWNASPPTTDLAPDSVIAFEAVEDASTATLNVWRLYPGAQTEDRIASIQIPKLYISWRGFHIKARSGGLVAGFYAGSPNATTDAGIQVFHISGEPVFSRNGQNPLTWEDPANTGDFSKYITPVAAVGVLAEDGGIFAGSTRQWSFSDDQTEGNYHRNKVRVWLGAGIGHVVALPADHYTADIELYDGALYVLAARRDDATFCTFRLLKYSLPPGASLLSQTDIATYRYATGGYPVLATGNPTYSGGLSIDADGTVHVLIGGLQLSAAGNSNAIHLLRMGPSGTFVTVVQGDQPTTVYFPFPTMVPFRVFSTCILSGLKALAGSAAPSGYHVAAVPLVAALPAPVALSSVVGDLTTRAGIASSLVDTSALTDTVTGFAHEGGQPVRDALAALMLAYRFGLADADAKLVCVPRGGAVELALTEADLVREGEAREPVYVQQADESELPAQVAVRFIHADNYEPGQQSARRIQTTSKTVQTYALPLVLTDAQAAQIADRALNAAWVAGMSARLTLSVSRLSLAAGAVFTVPYRGRTLRLLAQRLQLRSMRLEIDAVADSAIAYESYATAQPIVTPVQSVGLAGTTLVVPMDVPMLRPQDDGVGFYLAACPLGGSSWEGAEIQRATDGVTYQPLTTVTSAATIGRTDTALPAWPANEVRQDPFATLDVTLRHGSLSSGSESAPNRAYVGGELVQFLTATQLSAGKYRLSRLVRGLQGTEHMTAQHAAGEWFVLLTPSTVRRIDDEAATLNVEQRLKARSIGRSAGTPPETVFTNTGRRAKALPPIGLTASLQANGDTVFQWRRAVRKYGNPRTLAAAGLEETPTRSYEIDLISPLTGAVVRTLTVSGAEQVTYPAAQATADFGGTEFAAQAQIFQRNGAGRGIGGSYFVNTAKLGPVPQLLFQASELNPVANVIQLEYPVGRTLARNVAYDAARVLFGSRSLAGPNATWNIAAQGTAGFSLGPGDWYVGAWVYFPVVRSVEFGIVGQYSPQLVFELMIENGLAKVRSSGNGSSWLVTLVESSQSMTLGRWNHVAASRSGNTLRLFVNGVLRASSSSATAQHSNPTGALGIGYSSLFLNWFNDYNTQEIVIVTGDAYKTSSFAPIPQPYRFR